MTGAMNAAISGLKNHMQKLNVIGNNIANVNTYGYKSGRVVFRDAMYSTSSSGSNGTATVGGVNPNQIGYGMQISTIDLDMSTSSYFTTGRALDCMIDGDGFFLLGDKNIQIDPTNPETLKSFQLSRVGDFDFKADGHLTDGEGQVAYGFLCTGYDADGKPTFSDQLVPIQLPKIASYVTTVKDADGNDVKKEVVEVIYPTDGRKVNPDTGKLEGTATDLVWKMSEDAEKAGVKEEDLKYISLDSISIDQKTGKITGTSDEDGTPVTVGFIAIGSVTNPAGVTHQGGRYYKALEGAGDLSVTLLGGAAEMAGIDYVNGSLLGGADPNNPDAAATSPTGMRIGNKAKVELLPGGLEMSKTDLATEISEMITTQRGYQANTRIITVTDSMLEELVNMKR